MDSNDFYNYVVANYGSLQYTQRKILKWRTNWDTDPSIITPSMYSALGANQQPYWMPQYDTNFNVKSYIRSNTDIDVNTNLIFSVTPDLTTNTIPGIGDLVSLVLANNIMGTAEVITSNTSNITLNNVVGYYTRLVQYQVNTTNIYNVNDSVLISNSSANALGSIILANSIAIIVAYQGSLINGTTITLVDQSTNTSTISTSCQSVELRSDFGSNTTNGATITFSYSSILASPLTPDVVNYYEPEYSRH